MEASWTDRLGAIMKWELFELLGVKVTVGTLVTTLVILLATLAVAHLVRVAFERFVRRGQLKDPGTLRAIQRLVHYLILLIGFGVAMETVGFDLSALFAAGAVFAVAIGFAMQNITQNFVAGVILLVERSIKPGDILDVNGRIVRVMSMGIRSTVARTLDEEDIILPNSNLVQSPVKNYTLGDSVYRLRTVVGVTYGSDMAKVREVLTRVAKGMPWRVTDMAPRILMVEFGDNSVNFDVGVFITDPWRARELKSELNEAIWDAFAEAGIVIAFPQVDVHLDPPVTEALTRLGAVTRG